MKEGYKALGEFIRQIDIRNTEGKEDNLLGVSVQKQFIPSIANTVGTDFTKYKVVKKGQFTYIPDTSRRGDKIAIALLQDYEEGLVSNVYTVFEVIDEEKLLPEYLMLWFSRPEFDRYARFKSHGSVREIMDWDEMCKVELPVPSIEKQRSIVKAYKAITDRIELKRRINDNLEATAQAVYKKMFVTDTLVYYEHRSDEGKRGCYFNVNTPKTPTSNRQVPMLDFVKEAFLIEKKNQELLDLHCQVTIDGYSDFIFINRFGQAQHQGTLNKALRRIIRDCNDEQLLKDENTDLLLPHFSCHSLRHTFTTRMCEAGVNVKVIQDTLGHKDISTTLNIYTDVTKELKRSEFEGLDLYFKAE